MGLVVANTGVTCRLKMHSAVPIVSGATRCKSADPRRRWNVTDEDA